MQSNRVKVVPNVRFSDERTYDIAWKKNSTIALSTHGLMKIKKEIFKKGHSKNLKSAFLVNKNSIHSFIKNVIEQGKIVSNVKKR